MAEPLSLGSLGRILLRYWLLLLALTVAGGVAAFGASQLMTPVYTATATQLVKGLPGSGVAANYEAAQYAVSRAKSYPAFVYSSTVLEGVRSDMNNSESVDRIRKEISATNPADTPLVVVSATAHSPRAAQDKANSAARHLARFIAQIETVAGKSPIIVETPVSAALPTDTTSPRKVLLAALGAVVVFVVGAVLALVHDQMQSRRRSTREAADVSWWDEQGAQDSGGVQERIGRGPSAKRTRRRRRMTASALTAHGKQHRAGLEETDGLSPGSDTEPQGHAVSALPTSESADGADSRQEQAFGT